MDSALPVTPFYPLEYTNVLEARFLELSRLEGREHLRGLQWPTSAEDPGAAGSVLATASYNFNGALEALVRIEGALAHVCLVAGVLTARLTAGDHAALDLAEAALRDALPLDAQLTTDEVKLAFWTGGDNPMLWVRMLPATPWATIAANYSAPTRCALEPIMRSFRPGHGGRLVLWHGAAGTGKTFALRALASEWSEWCSVACVIDPERLFGSDPSYLFRVLRSAHPGGRGKPRWLLLVLEDTGELLAADAKSRTGQGLSRLLNLTDGLFGEGLNALVLITTNDELDGMHPPIVRAGRCAARVEFGALSDLEAEAWLSERGVHDAPRRRRTLAELYAIADGYGASGSVAVKPKIGFAS